VRVFAHQPRGDDTGRDAGPLAHRKLSVVASSLGGMTSQLAHRAPAEVAACLREGEAARIRAEIDRLELVVEWASLHPGSDDVEAAAEGTSTLFGDRGLALGGAGVPAVSEFAVMDLAAVLGRSVESTRRLLGQALELVHRLPRLWELVRTEEVEPWQALRVAEQTMVLPLAGALFVDEQVVAVAGRIGPAQLQRLAEAALIRFDPEAAESRRAERAEERHFTVESGQVSYDGHVDVHGSLDLADALDLDAAVADLAQQLGDLGCEESLDVRRAMALGELARHQPTLDVTDGDVPPRRRRREIILYAHLGVDALGGVDPAVEIEGAGSVVLSSQLQAWLADAAASVTVRPVIDLNQERASVGYQPSQTLREQVLLTTRHCAFPGCHQSARRADLDHIHAHADGGQTSSANLAPLCRGHHRLKTHGGWTYRQAAPGRFTWRSPRGETYLVDRHPRRP